MKPGKLNFHAVWKFLSTPVITFHLAYACYWFWRWLHIICNMYTEMYQRILRWCDRILLVIYPQSAAQMSVYLRCITRSLITNGWGCMLQLQHNILKCIYKHFYPDLGMDSFICSMFKVNERNLNCIHISDKLWTFTPGRLF